MCGLISETWRIPDTKYASLINSSTHGMHDNVSLFVALEFITKLYKFKRWSLNYENLLKLKLNVEIYWN